MAGTAGSSHTICAIITWLQPIGALLLAQKPYFPYLYTPLRSAILHYVTAACSTAHTPDNKAGALLPYQLLERAASNEPPELLGALVSMLTSCAKQCRTMQPCESKWVEDPDTSTAHKEQPEAPGK